MQDVGRVRWVPFAAALAVAAPAIASPKLEVVPSKLELCQLTSKARLTVIFDNPSDAPLAGLEIKPAGAGGIHIDNPTLGVVPAHASRSWDLTATCNPCAVGTVHLRATYRGKDQELLAGIASFEISPSNINMAAIGTMSVRPQRAELTEEKPGMAWLYVTNVSPYALRVSPTFHRRSDAQAVVKLVNPPAALDLAPFAMVAFPFGMFMEALGKDTMLVDAQVSWNDGQCQRAGSLVTSFDVEAGSTEFAMLIKLLGLPALLLLPGVLLLSASAILWRLGLALEHPRATSSEFWFSYGSPYFWVLAICVSFVWFRIYAWLGTDLRETYRLDDIIALWSYSLLIGALLHMVAFTVIRTLAGWRVRRTAARTPTNKDDAWTTLRKLALRGGTLKLRQAERGALRTTGFILAEEAQDKLWICPGITYVTPRDRSKASSIVERRDADDLPALVATFAAMPSSLRWARSGGPELVDRSEVRILVPFSILTADDGGLARDEPGL